MAFGKAKAKVAAAKTRIVRVGAGAITKARALADSSRKRLSAVNAKVKSKGTGLRFAAASLAGAAVTGAARGFTGGEVAGFDVAHIAAAGLGVAGAFLPGEMGNFAIVAAAGAEGPVLADLVEHLIGGDGADEVE